MYQSPRCWVKCARPPWLEALFAQTGGAPRIGYTSRPVEASAASPGVYGRMLPREPEFPKSAAALTWVRRAAAVGRTQMASTMVGAAACDRAGAPPEDGRVADALTAGRGYGPRVGTVQLGPL